MFDLWYKLHVCKLFIFTERDQQYIPPEERALYDPSILEQQYNKDAEMENKEEEEDDSEDDKNDEDEGEEDFEGDKEDSEMEETDAELTENNKNKKVCSAK